MRDETQQLIDEFRAVRDRATASEVLTQIRTLLEFAYHRFQPPPDFHPKARATEQRLSYGLEWTDTTIWLTAQPHQSDDAEYAIAVGEIAAEGKADTVETLYPVPKGLSELQIQPFVVSTVLDLLNHLTRIAPATIDESNRRLRSYLEGVPLSLDHLINSIQDNLRDRTLLADFFDFDHEATAKELSRPVRHNIGRLQGIVSMCRRDLGLVQKKGDHASTCKGSLYTLLEIAMSFTLTSA